MRTAFAIAAGMFITISAIAQGTKTRGDVKEYPATAEVQGATLGAESLGHNLSSEHGALFAADYLVVDVAVFPKGKVRVQFAASQFAARINGKKVLPDNAGMVAGSIKYGEGGGPMTGGGGMGGQPAPRFPGDPNGQSRAPKSPRVDTDDPNVPQRETLSVDEVVQRSALPEDPHSSPVSGFLYFPYTGKLKKVKSLEILYEGPYGEATLRLP